MTAMRHPHTESEQRVSLPARSSPNEYSDLFSPSGHITGYRPGRLLS
jgi:hypothetical protein